jgi:hypothetical protein
MVLAPNPAKGLSDDDLLGFLLPALGAKLIYGSVRTPKLVDSKGRELPTVRAVALSKNEEAQEIEATQAEENELLIARHNGGRSMSIANLAEAAGWILSNGDPHKSKVNRVLKRLCKVELVRNERGKWDLTDKGVKLAQKLKEGTD